MVKMRLTAVELHTDDVDALARFYRDVIGLDLGPGDAEATHYESSWGDWGAPDFFFFGIQPATEASGTTTGVEVGFEVDDVERVHARAVAAGAVVVEPPTARPWGTAATYRDPQGNLVQLTQG